MANLITIEYKIQRIETALVTIRYTHVEFFFFNYNVTAGFSYRWILSERQTDRKHAHSLVVGYRRGSKRSLCTVIITPALLRSVEECSLAWTVLRNTAVVLQVRLGIRLFAIWRWDMWPEWGYRKRSGGNERGRGQALAFWSFAGKFTRRVSTV